MNPGCDSLKKRRPLARLAVMYTDQASLPDKVCRCNIRSINRVHKVYGHFLPSVLDKNELLSYEQTNLGQYARRGSAGVVQYPSEFTEV